MFLPKNDPDHSNRKSTKMANISPDASTLLTKQFLQLLSNQMSPRLELVSVDSMTTPPGTRKSHSDVWAKFDRVLLDGAVVEFASCKKCRSILGHKSRGGTSGLRHHKCAPIKSGGAASRGAASVRTSGVVSDEDGERDELDSSMQPASAGRVDEFADLVNSIYTQSSTRAQPKVKKEPQYEFATKLKDETIKFMAKDLQSYEILRGEGFQNLVQAFVAIGAQYGNIDVRPALPPPVDIIRNLQLVAQEIRHRVAGELQECNHVAITTDFWDRETGSCISDGGNCYLTLSAHYFMEDGCSLNLRTRILATRRIGNAQQCAGETASWRAVLAVMDQYKLDAANVTVVTDNVQLKSAAFKSMGTLSSFVGSLNAAVFKALRGGESDEMAPLRKLFQDVDTLVEHTRECRIHQWLKMNMEESSSNHWANIFMKLAFVKTNNEKLKEELATRNDLQLISTIDMQLLDSVLGFLSLFKEALELLSTDMEPTLHFAVPWLHQLKTWCKPNAEDCDAVSALRATTLKLLETSMKVGDWHEVATIFNPRMKGLTFLSNHSRAAAYESLRRLVSTVHLASSSEAGEPSPKRSRSTVLDSLCDVVDESETADEVDLYLQHKVSNIESVLSFWELHRSQYPNLFKVMKRVLCIPAWCAAIERGFHSGIGQFCRKRIGLAPDIVDDVLILQSISDYL